MPIYINGERYRPYIDGAEVNVLIGGEYYHQVKRIRTITEELIGTNIQRFGTPVYATFKATAVAVSVASVTAIIDTKLYYGKADLRTKDLYPELIDKAEMKAGIQLEIGYFVAGNPQDWDAFMEYNINSVKLKITYTYMG